LAQAMVTKASLYQLCADHGVAVARWLEIRCRDFGAIEGRINFPIFVKPSRIHEIKDAMAGQMGWIVRCRADFEELQTRLPRSDHALIVQEIIPGPESNIALHCAYFDEKGPPQQSFTRCKLR
jgi:D-aspartate ligase